MSAHVLVVDDNGLDRRVLARAVEELGHRTTTAPDGRACLSRLREHGSDVDVVLLDLVMPDLDGFGVLSDLRADPRIAHLPVIVVSAADDVDSVVRSIDLGATDHLAKPVRRRILQARLAASLADKRVRDLERDHRERVQQVIEAAVAVEQGTWDGSGLDDVAAVDDALGTLARVFTDMARRVAARERALRDEVGRLRIEIDRERLADRVAAVTGSDYYRRLQTGAAQLRRTLVDGGGEAPDAPGRRDGGPDGDHEDRSDGGLVRDGRDRGERDGGGRTGPPRRRGDDHG